MHKKIISVLLLVTMLLNLGVYALAEDAQAAWSLTEMKSADGRTCVVRVSLSQLAEPVAAMEIHMMYDKSVMAFDGLTYHRDLKAAEISRNIDETNGIIRIGLIPKVSNIGMGDGNVMVPSARREIVIGDFTFRGISEAEAEAKITMLYAGFIITMREQDGKRMPITKNIPEFEFVTTIPDTKQVPTDGPDEDVKPTENLAFEDLAQYAWAKDAVTFLNGKNIIKGTSDTTFSPERNVTRADFVVLLQRLLGFQKPFMQNFSDVTEDKYYYDAVGSAKALNIAKGNDEKFSPEDSITREDLLVLTCRALEIMGRYRGVAAYDKLAEFSDHAMVSDYALEAMSIMLQVEIIKGTDNQISPKKNATRAETAVIFYRLYQLINYNY